MATARESREEEVHPGPGVVAAPARLGYQPALDGIRGIGILLVIGAHMGYGIFGSAYYAVDVFFVLSGFLITILLLQEHAGTGRISLRLFYRRRAARLLPALFTACALALGLATVSQVVTVSPLLTAPSGKATLLGALTALGYVTSWVKALTHATLGSLTPTWSLSVEEWFYALWPPLLIVLLRGRVRRLPQAVACIALAAIAYRLGAELLIHSRRFLYYAPDQRAGELLGGCALAAAMHAYSMHPRWERILRHRRLLGWVGLAGALAVAALAGRPTPALGHRATPPHELGGMALITLASVVLVASVVVLPGSGVARVLSFRPLVWTGQRSYGLYLYHPIILDTLSPNRPPLGYVPWHRGLAMIALSFLLAATTYRWLERPIIRRARERERRLRAEQAATKGVVPVAGARAGALVAERA
jgi:peptidoglycan/LPS O-acetylase OafA/YrhL